MFETIANLIRREPIAVLFAVLIAADAGLAAAEEGLTTVSVVRAVVLALVGVVSRYLVTPVADPAVKIDGERVPLVIESV